MSIRNIAIIAHVDHGKTTLVDKMLRQAGVFRANQQVVERVLDSNPLERERGITILSKNASVRWRGTKINIVDTPGHADFGGEVERILRMVDGVLLLVDAVEGPMPQTRFVTRKALALGLQPIVVINKVDRHDARPAEVHDEVLELFVDLEATNAQLDAPFLYASARDGYAVRDLSDVAGGRMSGGAVGGRVVDSQASPPADQSVRRPADLTPLFEAILSRIPEPLADPEGPFQMLVSTIDHSPYLGRIAIGRIERGRLEVGASVAVLPLGAAGPVTDGGVRAGTVAKLFGFEGLERVELETATAGDIVALAGLEGIEIGQTLTDVQHPDRLEGIAVEEPTISVDFMVNDSPFAGRSGKYVTTRQVRERLFREVERNVALRVQETDQPDTLCVSGRGELHLSILMETMRREGYEFQVSRPRVITREGPNGERLEPYEELLVDVPEGMLGVVMETLGPRRGELLDMRNPGQGRVRMRFRIPARGLFGYRSDFLTETRGEGVLHHRFMEYSRWAGPIPGRKRGVLVADREGVAVGYALFNLQERATMFVAPGDPVYEGMIVGEHVRSGDLDVNVSKEKKASNIRTTASDEMIRLEPPRQITLELALEYIEEDELIEVTPAAIRLRKRALAQTERRKAARQARAAME
ncbi:MAG TPA: translational GTPase TypA [Gemmatimonadales bacterium]|nr:translational GTPase TypA [Gemmatimonadales bacterium]